MSSRNERTGAATGAVLIVVGSITWLVVPVIAIWAVWGRASTATLAEPDEAIWVSVEAAPSSVTTDADLQLTWGSPPSLVAPAWSGVVQSVLVSPGDTVTSGTRLCVIDGVVRTAWQSGMPFYRSIVAGDTGTDVEALNEFLAAHGLSHNEGDKARSATVAGINEYARLIGAAANSVFDPGWLVYVQDDIQIADTNGLVVGAPAPSPGTEIVHGDSALLSAVLVPANAEAASDTTTSQILSVEDGQTVMLGAEPLHVAEDGAVTPESLTLVAQAVQPQDDRLRVEVTTSTPLDSVALPFGAIVSDGNLKCAMVRDGEAERMVPLEIPMAGTGRVYAVGDLLPGDQVRVPPGENSCVDAADD